MLLLSSRIVVRHRRQASVRLRCASTVACRGQLKLTILVKGKRSRRKAIRRAIKLGSAGFSLRAGKTTTVKLKLNAAGGSRLRAHHGRLTVGLTIAVLAPFKQTQNHAVRLVLAKTRTLRRAKPAQLLGL